MSVSAQADPTPAAARPTDAAVSNTTIRVTAMSQRPDRSIRAPSCLVRLLAAASAPVSVHHTVQLNVIMSAWIISPAATPEPPHFESTTVMPGAPRPSVVDLPNGLTQRLRAAVRLHGELHWTAP